MSKPAPICHVCGESGIAEAAGYALLRRVTSDCKPWPEGGRLIACPRCGCQQAVTDATWQAEADAIYRDYTIYYQSSGAEQPVFESSGQPLARSSKLIASVAEFAGLPARGRLLDIGCGNGGLLYSASQVLPGWSLAGTEYSDKYRAQVESIPGVEALYVGALGQIPGRFDVITMSHVLEHIPAPRDFLTLLQEKLLPDGLLVVDVPDVRANPFALLVADHCTHFVPESVTQVIAGAGFRPLITATDWISKEIVVVARRGAAAPAWRPMPVPGVVEEAQRGVAWLQQVADAARGLASGGELGVFGTSIAGTWLCDEVGEGVTFFVDEDPARAGGQHLGRPVRRPADVPSGASVYIALAPETAGRVRDRWPRSGAGPRLYLPPPVGDVEVVAVLLDIQGGAREPGRRHSELSK